MVVYKYFADIYQQIQTLFDASHNQRIVNTYMSMRYDIHISTLLLLDIEYMFKTYSDLITISIGVLLPM